MRRLAFIVSASLAAGVASAAAPAIASIEARLFYTATGTLSGNVAEASGVSLWNTVIGEGQSGGAANDTLIIVTVNADAGAYVDTPLVVEITDADGKPVASRKVEGLLVGPDGKVSTGVYLPDSTCTALTVKAVMGKSEKATTVPFACGE